MENPTNPNPQYQLPSAETLDRVADLPIQNEAGETLPFKTLFTPTNPPTRNLIIFIRHFYCGMCEQYAAALATYLPPSLLATTTPPTTLTFIGCGDPVCILDWRARSMPSALTTDKCEKPYAVYADRTRGVYDALGMVTNLGMSAEKPEYLTQSTLATTLASARNVVGDLGKFFKAGAINQNGGEWLFDQEGKLVWGHRMATTTDHAEVKELKEVLGIEA